MIDRKSADLGGESLGGGVTGYSAGNKSVSGVSDFEGLASLGGQVTGIGSGAGVEGGFGEQDSGEGELISSLPETDLSDRYEILGELGRGGMSVVHLAYDNRLKRKVGIKRIKGMSGSMTRFVAGAQALAAMQHYNIAGVYDFGRDKDGPFLIMEYVEGGSLQDKVMRDGPVEVEQACRLMEHLCSGMSSAHRAGIIHRDLKPANILLTLDGEPKIIDFDLAKVDRGGSGGGMTQSGVGMGTPDYMAPEQGDNAAGIDERADIYALGAIFYAILTASSPRRIFMEKVPESFRPMIAKCLEEDREKRYLSCHDLDVELKSIRGLGARKGMLSASESQKGKCKTCGTANEPGRKFCRNADCRSSLIAKCVQCKKQMPYWDDVCGECGSSQIEFLEKESDFIKNIIEKSEESFNSGFVLKSFQDLSSINWNEEKIEKHKVLKDEFDNLFRHVNEKVIEQRILLENATNAIVEYRTDKKWFDAKNVALSVPKNIRTDFINETINDCSKNMQKIKALTADIKKYNANNDAVKSLLLVDELKIYMNSDGLDEAKKRLELLVENDLRARVDSFIRLKSFDKAEIVSKKYSEILGKYQFCKDVENEINQYRKIEMKRIYDEEKAKEQEIEKIKESNRNTWFYQDADEEIIGPIGIEKVVKLIESRKIKRKTLVRQKSKSQWTKAWETSLSMYFDENDDFQRVDIKEKAGGDVPVGVIEIILKFWFKLMYYVMILLLICFVFLSCVNPIFIFLGIPSFFILVAALKHRIQNMF
jgi:serine/threonine protein kinase